MTMNIRWFNSSKQGDALLKSAGQVSTHRPSICSLSGVRMAARQSYGVERLITPHCSHCKPDTDSPTNPPFKRDEHL